MTDENMQTPDNSGGSADNARKDNDMVDARHSDAASENHRESERVQEADRAAAPSYELHTENESRTKQDAGSDRESQTSNPLNQGVQNELENIGSMTASDSSAQSGKPANPDETAKIGAELGGTTNLSLEQLKKEGGPSDTDEDLDSHRGDGL